MPTPPTRRLLLAGLAVCALVVGLLAAPVALGALGVDFRAEHADDATVERSAPFAEAAIAHHADRAPRADRTDLRRSSVPVVVFAVLWAFAALAAPRRRSIPHDQPAPTPPRLAPAGRRAPPVAYAR